MTDLNQSSDESPTMGYCIEVEQMAQLKEINKQLFGDGSILTPDKRRDLANMMCVILRAVETMPYTY